MSSIPDRLEIRALRAAATLLDETRLTLLQLLVQPKGDTAAGLARRTGMKRQLVNYHLRELEAAGLVVLVSAKRSGSVTERVMRAAARTFAIDPAVLGGLRADGMEAAAAESGTQKRAIAHEPDQGDPVNGEARIEIRCAAPTDVDALREDLSAEAAKLAAEYHDPAGSVVARVRADVELDL